MSSYVPPYAPLADKIAADFFSGTSTAAPQDAALQVAQDQGFNPEQAARLGNAVNTALFLAQLQQAAQGATAPTPETEFPMVDPAALQAAMGADPAAGMEHSDPGLDLNTDPGMCPDDLNAGPITPTSPLSGLGGIPDDFAPEDLDTLAEPPADPGTTDVEDAAGEEDPSEGEDEDEEDPQGVADGEEDVDGKGRDAVETTKTKVLDSAAPKTASKLEDSSTAEVTGGTGLSGGTRRMKRPVAAIFGVPRMAAAKERQELHTHREAALRRARSLFNQGMYAAERTYDTLRLACARDLNTLEVVEQYGLRKHAEGAEGLLKKLREDCDQEPPVWDGQVRTASEKLRNHTEEYRTRECALLDQVLERLASVVEYRDAIGHLEGTNAA